MGLVLFIISVVMIFIAFPICLLYALGKSVLHRRVWKVGIPEFMYKLFVMARFADQFGNAVGYELWNDWFLTKDAVHKFGNIGETMSEVFGDNQIDLCLTHDGRTFAFMLHLIQRYHCLKALGLKGVELELTIQKIRIKAKEKKYFNKTQLN